MDVSRSILGSRLLHEQGRKVLTVASIRQMRASTFFWVVLEFFVATTACGQDGLDLSSMQFVPLLSQRTAMVDLPRIAYDLYVPKDREYSVFQLRALMYQEQLSCEQVGLLLPVLFPDGEQPDGNPLPKNTVGEIDGVFFGLKRVATRPKIDLSLIERCLGWYADFGVPRDTPYVLPDDLLAWYQSDLTNNQIRVLAANMSPQWMDSTQVERQVAASIEEQIVAALLPFAPDRIVMASVDDVNWPSAWSEFVDVVDPLRANIYWSGRRGLFYLDTAGVHLKNQEPGSPDETSAALPRPVTPESEEERPE